MKRAFVSTLLVFFLCTLGIIGAEVLAQAYVYLVAEKGKRFQPDERLGWIPLPNMTIERRNADGDIYIISTDSSSVRGPSSYPDSDKIRRMLVLGDSFAFGEGVNLEDRFDTRMTKRLPDLAVINISVPGYGTDQQVIRARQYIPLLELGDIVLVLLYGNDFHDVARTRHSGRSKPWYEMSKGGLIEHKPDIGLVECLRDKSYLASILASRTDRDPKYEERIPQSLDIVSTILQTLAFELESRGIQFWIAVHGMESLELPFDRSDIISRICSLSDYCIDLDRILGNPKLFLKDGHWNGDGDHAVAEYLADVLAND